MNIRFEQRRLDRVFREVKKTIPVEETILLTPSTVYGVVPQSELPSRPHQVSRENYSVHPAQPGDFVISMSSFQHGFEYCDMEGGISPDYTLLRPIFDRDIGRFLRYSLKSDFLVQQLGAFRTGIRQGQRLQWNRLKYVKIPVPDKQSANKVGDFLDHETTRIDQLMVKKQRFLDLIEYEFDAFVSLTVTKGLMPHVTLKESGYLWEPQIPCSWTAVRLKFLCSKISDCLHETPTHEEDGAYPSVRTADVRRGVVNVGGAKKVSDHEYRHRIQRVEPRTNDILYSREGERYGIAALVPPGQKLCLGQRMMLFRANKRILPAYLMWSLNGQFAYNILKSTTFGATSPHLNIFDIRNVPVFLPPLAEQSVIVDAISARFVKKEALVDRLKLSVDRLREFRAALITAAVTGQIDVTKWGKEGQTDRRLDQIEEAMRA